MRPGLDMETYLSPDWVREHRQHFHDWWHDSALAGRGVVEIALLDETGTLVEIEEYKDFEGKRTLEMRRAVVALAEPPPPCCLVALPTKGNRG